MRNRLPRTLALAALLGPASCGPGSGPDGELRTAAGEGAPAASALPGPAPDGTPWPGLGGSVSPDSFHAELTLYARGLARSAHAPAASGLPATLAALSYDEYRAIAYRPDAAVWRGAARFEIQLFHPGFLYPDPVRLHLIEDGAVTSLPFDPALFEYRGPAAEAERAAAEAARPSSPAPGYAGFRIHYPINSEASKDEVAVFLGASYFRLLGPGQVHGLSSRGLAVDVAEPTGEEFPDFTAFWLVRPEAEAESLTFFALLEGPSVTGAYRFRLEPAEQTVLDVEARLFGREDVRKLGVAPLTSMYLYGPDRAAEFDDYRPQVHDSDGLLMWTSRDEWIWRPLTNRRGVQVTSLRDAGPRGYGLVQRERAFGSYLDLEARYDRRPSEWVEIAGDWGAGGVELVELPSPSEFNDNIVAYWLPEGPFGAGNERTYRYRLITFDERIDGQVLMPVERSRSGLAGLPGGDPPAGGAARRFVIDFGRAPVGDGVVPGEAEPVVFTSSGELSDVRVQPLPGGAGLRTTFVLAPAAGSPADMMVHLEADGELITERWSYLWVPPP